MISRPIAGMAIIALRLAPKKEGLELQGRLPIFQVSSRAKPNFSAVFATVSACRIIEVM